MHKCSARFLVSGQYTVPRGHICQRHASLLELLTIELLLHRLSQDLAPFVLNDCLLQASVYSLQLHRLDLLAYRHRSGFEASFLTD